MVDSCRKCSRVFGSAVPAIFCDICKKWLYLKCSNLTDSQFDTLCSSSMPYFCHMCISDSLPINLDQGSPTFLKLRATLLLVHWLMRRATSLIYTSKLTLLLSLLSIIVVLIFDNVKTLIMLMLFLEQARGWPTWSLWATWCQRAPRWWPLT